MEKEITPFTVLFNLNKQVLHTKEEIEKSGLNSYLLIYFIRTHPILVNVASYLNSNYKMNIYDQYLFVFLTFKRFKINDVKWIKSEKQIRVEDVDMIMRYYMVSYKTAIRYFHALSDNQIKYIKEYYDKGGAK